MKATEHLLLVEEFKQKVDARVAKAYEDGYEDGRSLLTFTFFGGCVFGTALTWVLIEVMT